MKPPEPNANVPPAEDSALRSGRLFWLDWLRFGAAFVVLIGHVRGGHFAAYGDLDPKYHSPVVALSFALTRLGGEAVVLFFVLSGFLVGGGSAQKAVQGKFGMRAYAVDRLTRIYTPLMPALVFTAGVTLIRGGHISVGAFCGNLAGLQGVFVENFGGNAPLWSLAYEIWFYILWGGVLTLLIGGNLFARVLAWIVVLVGLAIFTKLDPVYLFCWLLGALAYFSVSRALHWTCLASSILLIVAGLMLSQLTTGSDSVALDKLQAFVPSHAIATLLLAVGFAVLVRTVARWEPRTPHWKAFERLGTPLAAFSYTLYLVHVGVIGLWEGISAERARELDLYSLSLFVAKLLVCLGFAWVMYLLFERQTGRIRRWLNGCFARRSET
jgi:peptidoglycan/LPS O-acetylase OafA/YrhL